MMNTTRRAMLALLLCWPSLALAQAGPPTVAGGVFVLSLHCGPRSADDPAIKRLAVMFTQQGFSVQIPVADQDKVNGPGVDYYTDPARGRAQDVANAINSYLTQNGMSGGKQLQPRKQNSKLPANYLNAYLF